MLCHPQVATTTQVSPYVIKLGTNTLQRVGNISGNLYSIATIGSIFGTFVTVFVLIPNVAVNQIIFGLGIFCGAVYLFSKVADDWSVATELLKISSPEPSTGARFGQAVSVDPGMLAIGAPGHADDSGRVYVYSREDGSWPFAVALGDSGATEAPRLGAGLAIMLSIDDRAARRAAADASPGPDDGGRAV